MAPGDPDASRRRALAAVACGLTAGTAGCTGLGNRLVEDAEAEQDGEPGTAQDGEPGTAQDGEPGREGEQNSSEDQDRDAERDGDADANQRVDAETPTPPPEDGVGVDRHTDVVYRTTDERQLRLDLVRPADDVLRPLLVHVHGGGWRQGAKGYAHAERMARAGLAVASVEYRLSGEATFPAAVRDVVAAIEWLRAEAARFDADPDRVGLVGESAGGHLVALVANAPAEPSFQPDSFHPDQPVAVDAIVSISGIYDLERPDICHAPVTEQFLEGNCRERSERAALASPVTHVDAGDPPALLFHGTNDEVIRYEQATTYRDALADAGVAVDLHTADGGGHLLEDRAEAFLPRQESFLARHLDLAER